MSRIFLSEHGHVPVVVGSVITIIILLGAILLSAAPAMRSASVALMGGGFFVAILFAGWLSLGHAEVKEESVALAPTGPALGELKFEATDGLKFVPETADAETGIWTITLSDLGSDHTLDFDLQADMGFSGLHVVKQGEVQSARALFPEAGDFTFYCAIPGHRAAGMEGVVTVTGDPKTLEAAQAEVGDTGAGGGEGATETPTS
jgi:plastocyanin